MVKIRALYNEVKEDLERFRDEKFREECKKLSFNSKQLANLKELLSAIRARGYAEYDYVVNPNEKTEEKRNLLEEKLDEIKNRFEIKKLNSPEFFFKLKNAGYIYWESSIPPSYHNRDYLLAKIQESGKKEIRGSNDGYNWYIVVTQDKEFEGLETFDSVAKGQAYGLNGVFVWDGIAMNRTATERSFDSCWWLFDRLDQLSRSEEKIVNDNFATCMCTKFLAPITEEVKKSYSNSNLSIYQNRAKARELFKRLAAQEAMEIEIFYSYEANFFNLSDKKRAINRFLYPLQKRPSYYTLCRMALDHDKAAKELFSMFEEKGYSKEWLKRASLDEIKKAANKLVL